MFFPLTFKSFINALNSILLLRSFVPALAVCTCLNLAQGCPVFSFTWIFLPTIWFAFELAATYLILATPNDSFFTFILRMFLFSDLRLFSTDFR